MSDIFVRSACALSMNGTQYRCAVGENGFTARHREGDKSTPIGSFPLRECWYRADRMPAPQTRLPLRAITEHDGWCDDPAHPDYNRHIRLPFAASHEKMWRADGVYDVVVPLGFNDAPAVPGLGSAIFFHLATDSFTPTLGCVAIAREDMLNILKECAPASFIHIRMEP